MLTLQKCRLFRLACLGVFGFTGTATSLEAATYYVATNGNNTNNGSLQSPWLTIGYATTRMAAGDTVRVQPGTYSERVSLSTSGTSNSWINLVADGQAICRGFDLTGVSYVRIIGFEITHTDTTYKDGIDLMGTCTHVEILDNHIHDVTRNGLVAGSSGAYPSYITVRGNTLYYMGHVGSYYDPGGIGIGTCYITPHHWLIEYNIVRRAADAFIVAFGTNNIVRNNYCWDFQNSYWNTSDATVHADVFQCGSDGVAVGTRHHVYERNFFGDVVQADAHAGLWQDTMMAGDTNLLVRGNVAYNFGNGAFGVVSTKKVVYYNNTIYQITNGPAINWWKHSSSTNYPIGASALNTIIDNVAANSSGSIYLETGTPATTIANNLGYQCPVHSSFIVTNDPLFVDPSTNSHNFRLKANSPARAAGTNVLWVTSANGSGSSFTVSDSQLLCDGWGMVDGDTITVGGTTTVITNIDWASNIVSVRGSVTWTNGMAVYWGTDTGPTIGAFPYGSTPLTSATFAQSGSTYTVTPTGDARGVWFYVDGIPRTWASAPPFTATITNGTVTAKAYALYAQASPVIPATNAPPPAPPGGLRVAPSQ